MPTRILRVQVILVLGLMVSACDFTPPLRDGRVSDLKPTAEDRMLARAQVDAALARINVCERHSDCVLMQVHDFGYSCKNLGHNREANTQELWDALEAFRRTQDPSENISCTMDWVYTSTPCKNQRCVSNVDSYDDL